MPPLTRLSRIPLWVMGYYTPAKRVALLAALVFTAQARARDDTAEMFCRRVGTLTRRSRDELEALKQQHQEITERLVASYRAVLERIDPGTRQRSQGTCRRRRMPCKTLSS